MGLSTWGFLVMDGSMAEDITRYVQENFMNFIGLYWSLMIYQVPILCPALFQVPWVQR